MSQAVATIESSPAELERRIRGGDPGAETELVETYGQQLFFLLRRWTRDEETAQEIYQETFRRGLEKIRAGEVQQPDRLAAFLRSLAKNLSTYFYRRDDRRAVWYEETGEDWEAVDPSKGHLTDLLGREKAMLVREVLREMTTERDREVLTRYYLVDQDKDVICRDLALPEDHFKRVLFRARQRYKVLYEKRLERDASEGSQGMSL